MSAGFRCPECGQGSSFTAYELVIYGPISVDEHGYEPQDGKGLHYQIPDGTLMVCGGCGHGSTAINFMGGYWDSPCHDDGEE